VTRNEMLTSLRYRLNEAAADVWTDAELEDYLDSAIQGLYPYFFRYKVGTTIAGAGPVQTTPSGARNLYQVGQVRDGANRVRAVRGWTEGDGNALVPRLNIEETTLVWSWTEPYEAPVTGDQELDLKVEARECAVVRAAISALERVVTDRSKNEKYFAVQVREGVTEQDLLDAIDALHQTLKEHQDRALPLPERVA
jgi:hypothetical protein